MIFCSRLIFLKIALIFVVGSLYALPKMETTVGFFNPEILKIDEDKYIGNFLDDVSFIDESSNVVRVYDLLKNGPLILIITYFTCDAGCPLISKNTIDVTEKIEKNFKGLVLSFDLKDDIKDLKAFRDKVLDTTEKNASRWKFGLLNEQNLIKLTNSTGYKFFLSRKDRIFVHPNVLIIVSPDGKVSRYIYGIKPRENDIRIALIEAEGFKVSKNSLVDLAYLVCYRYDEGKGGYYINPVFVVGIIGVFMVSSVLVLSFIRRRRRYEQH